MKAKLIIFGLVWIITLITALSLIRGCQPSTIEVDPRDNTIDSLIRADQAKDILLAQNTNSYDSAIKVIESESFSQVVERFTTIYGKTDTIYEPTYLVDSTALAECNKQQARLDSSRTALDITEDKLNGCHIAFALCLDQRNEAREELTLWHDWDDTPKLRLIKRCRLKRKINNF